MWVNVIAIVTTQVFKLTGFELSAADQVTILGLVNLVLRAVTGAPVEFGSKTFAKK